MSRPSAQLSRIRESGTFPIRPWRVTPSVAASLGCDRLRRSFRSQFKLCDPRTRVAPAIFHPSFHPFTQSHRRGTPRGVAPHSRRSVPLKHAATRSRGAERIDRSAFTADRGAGQHCQSRTPRGIGTTRGVRHRRQGHTIRSSVRHGNRGRRCTQPRRDRGSARRSSARPRCRYRPRYPPLTVGMGGSRGSNRHHRPCTRRSELSPRPPDRRVDDRSIRIFRRDGSAPRTPRIDPAIAPETRRGRSRLLRVWGTRDPSRATSPIPRCGMGDLTRPRLCSIALATLRHHLVSASTNRSGARHDDTEDGFQEPQLTSPNGFAHAPHASPGQQARRIFDGPVHGVLLLQCLSAAVIAAFIAYNSLDLNARSDAGYFPTASSSWVLIAAVLGLVGATAVLFWRPAMLASSRVILIAAGVLLASSLILRALSDGLALTIAAAALSGIAVGCNNSALLSAALEMAPLKRQGRFVGTFSAAGALGQFLGPLLGLAVLRFGSLLQDSPPESVGSYSTLFMTLAALPLGWSIVLVLTRVRHVRRTPALSASA